MVGARISVPLNNNVTMDQQCLTKYLNLISFANADKCRFNTNRREISNKNSIELSRQKNKTKNGTVTSIVIKCAFIIVHDNDCQLNSECGLSV